MNADKKYKILLIADIITFTTLIIVSTIEFILNGITVYGVILYAVGIYIGVTANIQKEIRKKEK